MSEISKTRIPSPARSQGAIRTPRRYSRRSSRSKSVGSPARSLRISTIMQQVKDAEIISPSTSRRSILSDNTDIIEPRRKFFFIY